MVVLCVVCCVCVRMCYTTFRYGPTYCRSLCTFSQLVYNEIAYIKRNGSIAAFNKHILVFIIIIILGKPMPEVKCVTVYA